MFAWLKPKALLSDEDKYFQIATFRWLLRHFGGRSFYNDTQLILPTNAFFPAQLASRADAAEQTFAAVKRHAGLSDWPCHLQAQAPDNNAELAPGLLVQNAPRGPLGSFQMTADNVAVIRYNPALSNDPMQLVATFAHELAHYLTAGAKEAPPGGWDNWEFATDIAAVFMGFGLFMGNSAFNFSQTADGQTQGWRSSRNGYLSEAEFIFALAIFLELKQIPSAQATAFLKSHLKKPLHKALHEIRLGKLIDTVKMA